jgi:nitrite reductase (NADH) small subunit
MTPSVLAEYDLGPLTLIPAGEGRAYEVAGRQIAVFRLRSGAVRALDAVCPHRGGPIADGQSDGRVVLCPLHLTAFDLSTGCATGADYRLTPYVTAVTAAGHVIVTVPAD